MGGMGRDPFVDNLLISRRNYSKPYLVTPKKEHISGGKKSSRVTLRL